MGILEDFFNATSGRQNAQPGSTPATAPAQAEPAPAPPAVYPEFYKRYIDAAVANARAHPSSLFNWLSGRQTDAERSAAEAAAPAAWQQLQSGQANMQNAQLGTASNIAQTGAMAGVPIDPNNIPASVGDLTKAYMGMYGTGGGAPADSSATPIEAQRAIYNKLGVMYSRNPATASIATEYFKLRDQGLPNGVAVLPNGRAVDTINSQPVTGSFGAVNAFQAEPTKRMETGYQEAAASHQAGLDRGTHAVNADTDAAHAIRTGIDTRTGQPVTTTDAALLRGGAQNFADRNPFFDGQQGELKELRGRAESADQGLNLAQQISNAAQGLYTGKGAGTLQDVRKFALAAGQLTGAKVGDDVLNDASQFEQLKFASQQLVAVASHELSPRVAMNIYNQISAVKPGDATSVKGLRDIINNQIVPALSRSRTVYRGASDYYKRNPFKNDAMTVVPEQNPLQNFKVKSYPEQINPGDYFISRHDGTLKQAPVN